jgi:transposase InsO family protein
MPWKETCALDERVRFVVEYDLNELTMAELCRKYGISRKTGYKWVGRVDESGLTGLGDRSRAPHCHPNQICAELEAGIVAARHRHPTWGPRKLREILEWQPSPAASTIGGVLQRVGLVVPRKVRRRVPPQEQPFALCGQANAVWCADFKGWFRTGDGLRCDPLTLSDAYSRFLLRCQVVPNQAHVWVRSVFEAAFREYGLPGAIRTDNGSPFATRALAGLSALSVWWIKLGIVVERIEAGQPQQNGRHERMHRTLKEETAQPPASNARAQQRKFDRFRQEFNLERPHEALGMRTPGSVYSSSSRGYPSREPELRYPDGWDVRKVMNKGHFYWRHREVFLTEVLSGEVIGLEPVDDRYRRVWFGPVALGVLDLHVRHMLTGAQRRHLGLEWGSAGVGKLPSAALQEASPPQKVLPMCPV